MVQCLVVALAEITPPELKVLNGFCKYINDYFPNSRMLVVQIYYVSSTVWGELLCLFRFFWRVWISATWKLAGSHWRVLFIETLWRPAVFWEWSQVWFLSQRWLKGFFPHCILNHTGRAVLWKPGTLVDLECEMLGGGFKYFFFFIPIWANDPVWLIFFKWVETTT